MNKIAFNSSTNILDILITKVTNFISKPLSNRTFLNKTLKTFQPTSKQNATNN